MYEILLKWGLDTLSKVGVDSSGRDHAVLLEAIKTKNSLVVERFEIATECCNALIDLTLDVDAGLVDFTTAGKNDSETPKSTDAILLQLG